MLSPITLVSIPIILITSLCAAFFFSPEIDPALTLSISDTPVSRYWRIDWDKGDRMPCVWKAYAYLNKVYGDSDKGLFTGNIRYPFLDIQNFNGVPIITKSYFGACGDLLTVSDDGKFSFSWPSSYYNPKSQVHVLTYLNVTEVFTNNICSEEEQMIVDWYKSWAEGNKPWAHMFVHPYDDYLNPKVIRVVYYTHQVYSPAPDGIGCEGLIYDTSKMVPLYEEPVVYSTADVLNQSRFELHSDPYLPRFRLLNIFKGTCYHVANLSMWPTVYSTMVYPVDGLAPQDLVSIYFPDQDRYDDFAPGPISTSGGFPGSLLPKALIFFACATTLAFCTYIASGYVC